MQTFIFWCTCDDDDGPAEDVAEDEDVDVFKGIKLEAVATGDWGRHIHYFLPLLLPVLGNGPGIHKERETQIQTHTVRIHYTLSIRTIHL